MATSKVIQYGNNEEEHHTGMFASCNVKCVSALVSKIVTSQPIILEAGIILVDST